MKLIAVPSFLLAVWLLPHSRAQEGVCQTGDIRLAGGNSYLEGRVEICFRGDWGTVCDDQWDSIEANLACKQLGLSETGAIPILEGQFDQGRGNIIFDELACNGNESSFFECLMENDCSHSEDAGVRCQNNDVSLVHEGLLLPNNSLLSLEALGDLNASTTNPLLCVTSLPSCCNTNRTGNWFPPNGTSPLDIIPNPPYLHQSWGDDQSIRLHRPSGAASTERGLYHCEVPNIENAMRFIYVGIYSSPSDGIMEITSLTYVRSSQTLICTSTGGPATSVSWSKDGDPLVVDGITYQQSQVITNTLSATYENKLRLVTKSDSLSGMYSCLVTNSRGQATQSTEVIVCRDDEVRLVREVDNVTATVQLCVEDQWLNVVSPLHVQATEPAPGNVQISATRDGFLLSWDSPLTNKDILSYDVICTEQSPLSRHTVSVTLDNETLRATIPVRAIYGVYEPTDYQCCVRAYTDRYAGLMFMTESCLTASFTYAIDSPGPTTRSTSTVIIPSQAPQSTDRTLVFVLGGISAILFLTLLLVALALVGLIVFHARSHDGDRVDEPKKNEEYSCLNLDAKPASNPVYDSIEHEAIEATAETSLDTSSKHLSGPSPNIFNPLYTSINDFEFRRTCDSRRSSGISRNSISHNEVLRSNSTSALIGRKISAENDTIRGPSYSMIVPRHLRRKASSPMEIEDVSDQHELPTSPVDDDSTSQTYAKLQH